MKRPSPIYAPDKPRQPEKRTVRRASVNATVELEEHDKDHCYECGGRTVYKASLSVLEQLVQQMKQLDPEISTGDQHITVVFSDTVPVLEFDEIAVNARYETDMARYKRDMTEYNKKLKAYNEKLPFYEKQLAEYNAWKAKDDLAKAQKRLAQAQKLVENLQKRA